jgi:hypothetical protein
VQLRHLLGTNGGLLVQALAQQVISPTPPLATQTIVAGWESIAGAAGGRFLIGATRVNGSGATRLAPAGSAELHTRLAHGVTTLRYERSVGYAFGIGQLLLTDQVGGGYDYATRFGTVFQLRGNRSWSANAVASSTRLITTELTVGLQRDFRSGVSVSSVGFARRREEFVRFSGTGARLGLEYRIGAE